MFKKIICGASLAAFLLFGAGGCSSDSANRSATAKGNAAAQTGAPVAEVSKSETAANKTDANLKGGTPVPAKQGNSNVANGEGDDDSRADDASRFEHIKSDHQIVLKKYLKNKSHLRPAIEADYDRANPKLVAIRKENQRNHPYYVADDFNGDGQEDFIVILKSETAKNSFRIAVFNGPLDRNDGEPSFSGASDYRFALQFGDSPDMPPLYIGSYASDDGFILEASGKGYKVVTLLE